MNFQELIEKAWPDVRRRHLFPELPAPQVEDNSDEAVSIQMQGKTIRLSRDRLSALSQVMDASDAVSALLDHGVAHHAICPWDFETHLKLYAQLKPVLLDGDLVKRVVDYFMDVVVDTHCVRERASHLPEVYRHAPPGKVSDVIRALYQRLWGADLSVADVPEVDRLARIPYLDAAHWSESIRSFAQVVGPLIELEAKEGTGDGTGGMMGAHGMQQYAPAEIEAALEKFAQQGFYAFRAMVEDFEAELEAAGAMPQMGRGKGTPSNADLLFYMKRAASYRLPVRTRPLEKVGGLHPHSHAPWEVGKPVQDIDVWTSFGRVMPGISQVWKWQEGETHGASDGTPDCLIMIDSSGSMTDPGRELSHAVLGAGCAADAYLRRDRRVAVYNFSDAQANGKEVLDFTRDRKKVFWTLCRYFGGGTALHLPDVVALLRAQTDVFLITDMQIANLDALMQFLVGSKNRVTAVHIGQNRDAAQFRQRVQSADHICVYEVNRAEDIPDIVLAEVKARFGSATHTARVS